MCIIVYLTLLHVNTAHAFYSVQTLQTLAAQNQYNYVCIILIRTLVGN